jgi:colanic acid/amylovoran biosynthesis glycosyltransferase
MQQNILVFTKKVLPNSNTFVAVQTKNIPNFHPIYIGFKETKSARELIGDAPICIQNQHESIAGLKKLLLECCSYLTKGWLSALKSHQTTLVHAHFGKGGFYCLPIAQQLKLPLVVTFHGSDITQKDKFSYSAKHRHLVFKRADKIIAVSKFIEKKLIERGCSAEKIVQLYTGIDSNFFTTSSQESETPSLMFLGRLIKQKGCHLLIEAMAKVTAAIPNVELVIVGDGIERSALEIQAETFTNIKFVGEKNSTDVKHYLDHAWIMCAPSIIRKRGNEEGLGSVFLEAQAMQTPVVSFNTGGVSEAVLANKTGIIIDEINSDALASALIELLKNHQMRQKFKVAGREHVVNNFNVFKQSSKLATLYQETIQKHSGKQASIT